MLDLALAEQRPRAGLDRDDVPTVHRQNVDALGIDDPHAVAQRARDRLADVWESYFKFTIVRNPWDWLVSLHLFWLRHYWDSSKVPGLRGVLRRRSSTLYRRGRAFDQAQQLLRSGQYKESVELALRRGLYHKELTEIERFYYVDGCRYADQYLRFENLQDDFDSLCRRLGIEQRMLPKAKAELRKPDDQYPHYYTTFSRQHVADCCGRMLDDFGYRFG